MWNGILPIEIVEICSVEMRAEIDRQVILLVKEQHKKAIMMLLGGKSCGAESQKKTSAIIDKVSSIVACLRGCMRNYPAAFS